MLLTRIIGSEYNLFAIGLALNGLGIMAFLYNQSAKKVQ